MNLKILLPFKIFLQRSAVSSISAETCDGCFELLPHRLDCAAALVPGLLSYTCEGVSGAVYTAVDVGALVKCGDEVRVCTRRAAGGDDLAALREQVLREYLAVDVREQEVRAAVWKMQGALIRQFAGLHHER